ncbi:MAG: hypothetical protein R2874_13075 [Desulfobacterales bacterium]
MRRVCHHPCEGVCTRGDYDESLAIRELHRFLADWEQGQETPIRRKSWKNGMKKWQWSAPGRRWPGRGLFPEASGIPGDHFEKLPMAGGMMAVGIPEPPAEKYAGLEIETIKKWALRSEPVSPLEKTSPWTASNRMDFPRSSLKPSASMAAGAWGLKTKTRTCSDRRFSAGCGHGQRNRHR